MLSDKQHSAGDIVQHDGEVVVPRANGDFVYSRNTPPVVVGLAEVSLQKFFLDLLDRFPVQAHMLSYFFYSHDPAKIINIAGHSVCHARRRMK